MIRSLSRSPDSFSSSSFLFFFFSNPGSEMRRATYCTLRLGTGWTSSALLWTRPDPHQSTSSTSSTSCRLGSRRTAARWWARPTLCSPVTNPPASAASPSSSRSSHPTCGVTNSRACMTTTSSVSGGRFETRDLATASVCVGFYRHVLCALLRCVGGDERVVMIAWLISDCASVRLFMPVMAVMTGRLCLK